MVSTSRWVNVAVTVAVTGRPVSGSAEATRPPGTHPPCADPAPPMAPKVAYWFTFCQPEMIAPVSAPPPPGPPAPKAKPTLTTRDP